MTIEEFKKEQSILDKKIEKLKKEKEKLSRKFWRELKKQWKHIMWRTDINDMSVREPIIVDDLDNNK